MRRKVPHGESVKKLLLLDLEPRSADRAPIAQSSFWPVLAEPGSERAADYINPAISPAKLS